MTPTDALNRLSLVQQSLRHLSDTLGNNSLASTLRLLADNLENCLLALDTPHHR